MVESKPLVPILIVDDSPENLLVLEAVLRRPGFRIVQAGSGKEAIVLANQQEFAAIVLDVMMPEMDGYETAMLIRKNTISNHSPIIFVTAGMNERELINLGYEAGAVDYIFKPFDPQIMKSKIDVFADLYLVKRENEDQARLLRMNDQREHIQVLENAMDAVIQMDTEGNVNYWNLQAEKIFGWSKREAIGQKLSRLIIPPRYREAHEKGLSHFLMTGEGPILNKRIEIEAIKKDGTEIPVELSVTPLRIDNKFSFSAFVRDISERKKEQEKIRVTEENLRSAIKARDEFISICSHELKTPLTSMRIQFQLAQKLYREGNPKVFEKESVRKRIEISNKQLSRMGRLIDNMLDVSNISSGKLALEQKEVDLLVLTKEIIDSFQEQLEYSHIDLKIETKSPPFLIQGDAYRMEQVISNLLNNAIKYGNNNPVKIIFDHQGDKVLLSFVDEGLGIDPKNLKMIFNRYDRGMDSSKISGLGLGLYLSKQIVEAHKGQIKVESVVGKGSTFTVEFPAYRKEAELSH